MKKLALVFVLAAMAVWLLSCAPGRELRVAEYVGQDRATLFFHPGMVGCGYVDMDDTLIDTFSVEGVAVRPGTHVLRPFSTCLVNKQALPFKVDLLPGSQRYFTVDQQSFTLLLLVELDKAGFEALLQREREFKNKSSR
jgi:hypothetical protein